MNFPRPTKRPNANLTRLKDQIEYLEKEVVRLSERIQSYENTNITVQLNKQLMRRNKLLENTLATCNHFKHIDVHQFMNEVDKKYHEQLEEEISQEISYKILRKKFKIIYYFNKFIIENNLKDKYYQWKENETKLKI